jgi:succinoglycan biosynthesis transport protein ExoP
MTQQHIKPYEPVHLGEPLAAEEIPADARNQGIGQLLAAVGRRWKIALAVWCLLAPFGVTVVWFRVKPTYTATAQVEVAPIVPAILYEDDKPMPLFDTYLNTQSQIMVSQQVLTAALADPTVQLLPLLKQPEPLARLRNGLSVKTIPRTHLMELEVTQADPDSAMRLARAVLGAYMARAAGAEQEGDRRTRQLLEAEQSRLRAQLDRQSNEIRKLAEAYGTSSEKMFEILREGLEKYTLETKQELERADLEIFQLQQQIEQVQKGNVLMTQPDEWHNQRQAAIEADPGVRLVRRDLESAVAKQARLASAHGVDPKLVVEAQHDVQRLRDDLAKERKRAAADIDNELAQRQQERLEQTSARLANALAMAQRRRQVLQERVDKRDAEGMSIGRQGLEIQNLREQRELTRQDYERVVERLKRLEIESQRPTRISMASPPEIRPDGIVDKRFKMTVLAVFGSLFVALFAALVRDRLDPRVHNVEEVETGTGLRLLGAVPSVADMQAGRITREQYLESFRVIRANLASVGSNGSAPRSMLVTSAQAGEGKTSLAVSLAVSLTESGRHVLLVDGDIQLPQIARLLKLAPACDLKGVLLGSRSLKESVTESGIAGLQVLADHDNGDSARGTLNTQSAIDLVKQATSQYDYVVIDSPPVLGAADALFWAHAVDGVILTSLVGRSDRKAIRLARQRLASVGATLLGSVIANVSISESYYSYSASSCRSTDGAAAGGTSIKRTPPTVYLPDGRAADGPP